MPRHDGIAADAEAGPYANFDEPAADLEDFEVLVFPPETYGSVTVRLIGATPNHRYLREHITGRRSVADEASQLSVWACERGFARNGSWTVSAAGTWSAGFTRARADDQ